MKNLILLRHAKSISVLNEMSDFRRTLNERGRSDVPKIANAFNKLNLIPDIILCSDAYRTMETLKVFMDNVSFEAPIAYLNALYHASASGIFELVSNYKDCNNIMVVGHNFGIIDVANQLCNNNVDEMKTCALVILGFEDQIEFNKGKVLYHFIPKNFE